MKKFPILCCLLSLAFVETAHADWKQTKWGMSVDQVKRSVKDAVSVDPDPSMQYNYNMHGNDKVLLVEDYYKVDDMTYSVRYVFDEKNKLKSIEMHNFYTNNYIKTFNLLSGKYGKPASSVGNGGDLSTAIWYVPEKHLMIKLQGLMGVRIIYTPETDAL